jgi:hypothetical protein
MYYNDNYVLKKQNNIENVIKEVVKNKNNKKDDYDFPNRLLMI